MTSPKNFAVGDWSVFPARGLVVRGEARERLRPKTMDLLVLLASRPGETVPKETIFETVWPGTVVEEAAASRCVSELRATFDDDVRKPRYVETIPRRGYRLVARVGPLPSDEPPRSHSRWLAAILAAALLGAALTIAFVRHQESPSHRDEAGAPPTAPAPVAASVRRTVVLGVANLSGDPEADWLGQAFSRLLTTELATTTGLRLVPQAVAGRLESEMALRSADPPSPAVLERLHAGMAVDYLVNGHYVLAGGDPGAQSIRLDVVVTDTTSGEIVAAAAESGSTDDLPQIVTLATMRLREGLGLSPPMSETADIERQRRARALPQEFFRGLLLLERFEATAAVSELERAVDLAPDAPWPHLALAEAWSLGGCDRRAIEQAHAALTRSAVLDNEDRLWLEARAHALAGHWDDAISRLRALWLLAPDNLEYGLQLASTLLDAGRAEKAGKVVAEVLGRAPAGYQDPRFELVRGDVALALSDTQTALAAAAGAAEQARGLNAPLIEGRALYLRARALHTSGRGAEARETLETARLRFATAHDRPSEAAARLTMSLWLTKAGQYPAAEVEARAALAISRAVGDRSGEAEALLRLGVPVWWQNRRDEGEKDLRTALAIFRRIGDRAGEASALSALGVAIASLTGEDGADVYFQQALEIDRSLGQREQVSLMLVNVGRVALLAGDPRRAVETFGEAAGMDDVLTTENRARVLFNLAYARTLTGQVVEAQRSFEQARDLYRGLENQRMLAATLKGLGELLLDRDELDPALADLRESLRIFRTLGEPNRITLAQAALSRALADAGQADSAERFLQDAIEQNASSITADALQAAQLALAEVQLVTGHAAQAYAGLDDLRRVRVGDRTVNTVSRQVTYARVLAATGRTRDAEELLQAVHGFTETRGLETLRLETEVALLEVARARGESPEPDRVFEVERQARQHGLLRLARRARAFLPPGAFSRK